MRVLISERSRTTCEAKEKFGPGERFLFGSGGALAAPPEFEPFRFRLLLAGRWVSITDKYQAL